MPTTQPLLWRASEAAQALTISESKLWKMVKAAEIPVVRMGRSVRFDPVEIQAWISRQRPDTQSAPATLRAI